MEFNRSIVAATAAGVVILVGLGCNSSNTLTGTLLAGAPVEGIRYVSESTSGITTAQGEFEYKDDELVQFYVGDILLGTATGAARMSPFNLAGIEPPVASKDIQAATQIRNLKPAGTPFENAVNLTVFLLTLDDDGDPANGIRIPERAAELGTGQILTFNTSWETFHRRFAFSPFLKSARQSGVWAQFPRVVGPNLALDTVYAGLGLHPELLVADEIEHDDNGDGVGDWRSRVKFSADGSQQIFERTESPNGVYTPTAVTKLDQDGNLATTASISPDGVVQAVDNVYRHDPNGYIDQVENGNPVSQRIRTSNDLDGLRSFEEIDTNNDGAVDIRAVTTYDSDGRLLQIESDSDMDGVANQQQAYHYDPLQQEQVIETGSSLQKPHPVQLRRTQNYSDNGLEVAIELINVSNPISPSRGGRRYDSAGNILDSYWIDPTTGAEQPTEKISYNEDGQLQSIVAFSGGKVSWRTIVLSYQRVNHWAALDVYSEFDKPAPPATPPQALGGGGGGGGGGM